MICQDISLITNFDWFDDHVRCVLCVYTFYLHIFLFLFLQERWCLLDVQVISEIDWYLLYQPVVVGTLGDVLFPMVVHFEDMKLSIVGGIVDLKAENKVRWNWILHWELRWWDGVSRPCGPLLILNLVLAPITEIFVFDFCGIFWRCYILILCWYCRVGNSKLLDLQGRWLLFVFVLGDDVNWSGSIYWYVAVSCTQSDLNDQFWTWLINGSRNNGS